MTYVNEIDIRKVTEGQPVTISLDSDPTKQLSGEVTRVANVGEQRPNTDAKVFEVVIAVHQSDTTLRPGMTTGNSIRTLREEAVLFIPIEALGSEDGVPFVYQQDGGRIRKQEVVPGAMNDTDVIIVDGLEEDDRVLLTPPANGGDMPLQRLENSPIDAEEEQPQPVAGGDTAITY